ncbi:acyl-CoA thioesterase [Herbiconiux sp. SYSU D00978]|uniref:acyl-CoA thioesterase n=1 Tax=Herbiconiux sp. SYSU D00978 TaxID=2812562 RepID=UPI001F606593|nr:acyl-CoA thioesterase [Herbiconiux sp. SYSU D00978]
MPRLTCTLVNKWLHMLWVMLTMRRRSPLTIRDVGRIQLRVTPDDLDVLRHMNNGVYLSLMDLGRVDLLTRAGIWQEFKRRGWYPVVAAQTITYRKSLNPGQRYTLETAIAGFSDRDVFVEQRFVVGDEIYARGFVRGRFLKRSGGSVSIGEIADASGVDITEWRAPEWLVRWADDVALPSTRAEAPSEWAR